MIVRVGSILWRGFVSMSLHRVAQWPMWLAFLYTPDDVLQLYIYKDRHLPKDSLQLDDFRFSADRVECHFFLIFWTNMILPLLLLIYAIKTKICNHLINKAKNLGYDRRLLCKQPRQESGFCCFSFARYSQKCVTQIYRALYGTAMFAPFGGAQTWRP